MTNHLLVVSTFGAPPTQFSSGLVVVRHFSADSASRTSKQEKVRKSPQSNGFSALNCLSDEMLNALNDIKVSTPTEIQQLAIPSILQGQNVLLASHTGSGKTLAFLVPVIESLRRDERREQNPVTTRMFRPRALVILPTRELCYQVGGVVSSLKHSVRIRMAMMTGGPGAHQHKRDMSKPVDLLVTTPGWLKRNVEDKSLYLSDVQYVVVDEADMMYTGASKASFFLFALTRFVVPNTSSKKQYRTTIRRQCVILSKSFTRLADFFFFFLMVVEWW